MTTPRQKAPEVDGPASERDELQTEIVQLHQECHDWRIEFARQNKMISALTGERDALQARVEELEGERKLLQDTCESWRKVCKILWRAWLDFSPVR
jgi:predicted nuclease with TOPRIM domain